MGLPSATYHERHESATALDYMQITCTQFHNYQAINVDRADINSFTSPRKL